MEEGQPCYLVNQWPAESYRPGAFPLALAGSVAGGVRLDRLDSFGVLWSFVRPDEAFGGGSRPAQPLAVPAVASAHGAMPNSATVASPGISMATASSASVFDAHLGSTMGVPAILPSPSTATPIPFIVKSLRDKNVSEMGPDHPERCS